MENYSILEDLGKYYPKFNRSEFEKMDDAFVMSLARNYYKNHLPVDVTAWYRVNHPDEKLIFKDGLSKQICFIRDDISCGLFYGLENADINGEFDSKRYEALQPVVIGTHRSKSVLLPVMELTLKSVGIKMVFRNNFYDWCVSVESDYDINCDFKGLITDCEGFFEGFPPSRVYPPYSKKNKKRFSFCIGNNYDLYTLMFLLKDYLYLS